MRLPPPTTQAPLQPPGALRSPCEGTGMPRDSLSPEKAGRMFETESRWDCTAICCCGRTARMGAVRTDMLPRREDQSCCSLKMKENEFAACLSSLSAGQTPGSGLMERARDKA